MTIRIGVRRHRTSTPAGTSASTSAGSRAGAAAAAGLAVLLTLLTLGAAPVPAHAQASTPTSTQPSADPATPSPAGTDDWLARLNQLRSQYGSAMIDQDPELSRKAQLHADYMAATGHFGHSQDPSSPHYTADGDTAAGNSNLTYGAATAADAIDSWHTAPFHALQMLHGGLRSTGFGRTGSYAVLDVLSDRDISNAGTYPKAWPAQDTTIDLYAYRGGESPDPLTPCPGLQAPTGTPLYISFGPSTPSPQVLRATLTADGAPAAACVATAASYTGLASRVLERQGTVVLIPHAPLTAGTSYTMDLTTDAGRVTRTFTAQRHPAKLNAHAFDSYIGESATIDGNLTSDATDLAGASVTVATRPAGSTSDFTAAGRTTVEDNGLFTASITPTGPTEVQLVFAGTQQAQSATGTVTITPAKASTDMYARRTDSLGGTVLWSRRPSWTVDVHGTGTAAPGGVVQVWFRPSRTLQWQHRSSVALRPGSGATSSATYSTAMSESGRFQFRYVGTDAHTPTRTGTIPINVKTVVGGWSTTASTHRAGSKIVRYPAIAPGHGRLVYLQQSTGRTWRNVTSMRVRPDGRLPVTVTVPRGTSLWRLYVPSGPLGIGTHSGAWRTVGR